jgi:hypothetical protein
MLDPAIGTLDSSKVVLAIGALGTAAYGLVDATKGFGGGISNRGFGDIKKVISKLIPASAGQNDGTSALALKSSLDTLRANWMNGMAMADQKSIAKGLIKLNLKPVTASKMAAVAGVDANLLTSVAGKLSTGESLTQQETDVYGRFDLLLSSLLDQAYQRGDQRYRNSAKVAAVFVSVALAWWSTWFLYGKVQFALATVAGLLATPLSPVAKDLSSAIQAGAKVAQFWKK